MSTDEVVSDDGQWRVTREEGAFQSWRLTIHGWKEWSWEPDNGQDIANVLRSVIYSAEWLKRRREQQAQK